MRLMALLPRAKSTTTTSSLVLLLRRLLSSSSTTTTTTTTTKPSSSSSSSSTSASTSLHRYSYIVAPDQLLPGMKILNSDGSPSSDHGMRHGMLDPLSQVGNSMPLSAMRIGTFVHCVEHRPGEGACFVRAAGTSAKILRLDGRRCVLRMPSGFEKEIDARCRATIGRVSNPERKHRKLRKAGQSRWLGRRPVVRGVAMNPVDHPHGGGEGKTSGGRPSVTPWGKPTKSGYKTVLKKNHYDPRAGRASSEGAGKRKGKRS